jgi:DNA modification methylase
MHSYIGAVVLDPFNGSGTTTSVANKLGRKWIGYDITEDYCQLAEERI